MTILGAGWVDGTLVMAVVSSSVPQLGIYIYAPTCGTVQKPKGISRNVIGNVFWCDVRSYRARDHTSFQVGTS